MEYYHQKRRLKYIILLLAVIVGSFSLIYSNYLVGKLKEEERRKMEVYASAMKKFAENDNLDADMSLITEIITRNTTIPLILTDENDSILAFVNLLSTFNNNPEKLYRELEKMKRAHEPIIITLLDNKSQKVYYHDSTLLTALFWYPIIQLSVFVLFVVAAYLAFSNSRKAEQNRVWAGMAKETAHQLGTPISSLLAWTEILNDIEEARPYVENMKKDIERLNTIVNRFSKIGSLPDLQIVSINQTIQRAVDYLKYRVPNRISITYQSSIDHSIKGLINENLLEWVIENLVRNAIDAMQGEGEVKILVQSKERKILIDVEDTGKGIQKKYHKTVFSPGFTTKQRGWGLGLSLSKRIIEEYHHGKIYVKTSEPGKGTVIRIILPLIETQPHVE